MKVAYADPPYMGMAYRYPEKTEVDHRQLVTRLIAEFPDGWALSCHTPSLGYLLSLCPHDTRVGAWVKPFAAFHVGVGVAYAWEPILFRGGRKREREQPTVRDWVTCNITMERGVIGAKPKQFCFWLFAVLNLTQEDELVDLFPGSGAVMDAWNEYRAQGTVLV